MRDIAIKEWKINNIKIKIIPFIIYFFVNLYTKSQKNSRYLVAKVFFFQTDIQFDTGLKLLLVGNFSPRTALSLSRRLVIKGYEIDSVYVKNFIFQGCYFLNIFV